MNSSLELLEVVALTEALTEAGRIARQVGTVVEQLATAMNPKTC